MGARFLAEILRGRFVAVAQERWWYRVMEVDVIVEDLGDILETVSLRLRVMS